MLLERIEDKGLSHYSYLVACEGAGLAVVVDPRRDVDVYLQMAAARDLRIAYVLETHIHADFASGARELAERAGAELCLSAYDEGELYDVRFPHRELRDGDAVRIGAVRIQALHTPGHTPEHVAYLVFDEARSADVPMVMLSGDFLFVGSLGRPDLLGEEAKLGLARQLYRSVREQLPRLPDGLEIAPGHGAGSMCGAGMSGRPVSTLGFERLTNPYLRRDLTEEAFVATILGNVPPFPPYYRRMKVLNSEGPPLLHGLPGRRGVSPPELSRLVEDGHLVVDLRDQLAFGAGHVPGAFGLGAGTNLSMWASWVLPYEEPLLLVGDDRTDLDEAVRALVRVGLDEVRGHLAGGFDSWVRAGLPQSHTPQISPHELQARLSAGEPVVVLDVRGPAEWRAGHIAEARHVPAHEVPEQAPVLANGRDVAVVCASGYRSTVAASVLERAGVTRVSNLTGGMNAWRRAGLPVVC
jgi:hydroxyacylglutathione hydrolase